MSGSQIIRKESMADTYWRNEATGDWDSVLLKKSGFCDTKG